MTLREWLGDEPGRIVGRSRYGRLPWKFVLVASLGLVALYALLSLIPAGGLVPHGGHRAFSIGDTWLTRTVVGVGVLLLAWYWGRSARRREYHEMLRRVGRELGLTYQQHNTQNPLDRFAWSLTGEWAGRAVKMARVPPSMIGAGGRFFGAVVLSVPCEAPGALSAFIGRRRDIEGAPTASLPQPHLASLGIWAGEDELDSEAVGGMTAVELLAADGLEQVGLEIKEGRARLYYDLGSPVLDFHPPFVRRALDALAELAGSLEE